MSYWKQLEEHIERPIMQHLRSFLTDLISSLRNFENYVVDRVRVGEDKIASQYDASLAVLKQELGANLEERLRGIEASVIEFLRDEFKKQEARLSAVTDNLSKVVQDLTDVVTAHDTAVQAALAKLNAGADAGDMAAVKVAADAIGSLSAKVASETQALNDKLNPQPAPANPAPADPAAPAADPAAPAA